MSNIHTLLNYHIIFSNKNGGPANLGKESLTLPRCGATNEFSPVFQGRVEKYYK
jgi:hypothetical protein